MSSQTAVKTSSLLQRMQGFCKSSRIQARALLGVCLFAGSMAAQAAPLGLTQSFPDILASDLALSFSSSSFTATSTVSSFFDKELGNVFISDGSYSLSIPTNAAGNLTGPGSLSIFGNIGSGIVNLLSGVVTSFGFSGAGTPANPAIFEFLVNLTSSAPSFGFGSRAGIIITSNNLVTSGNALTGTGNSDNFNVVAAVPEPASLFLMMLGGIALIGVARRRSNV